MQAFQTLVFTPAGLGDVTLAVAASRAGAVGVYNGELEPDTQRIVGCLERLGQFARGQWGARVDHVDSVVLAALEQAVGQGMAWLVVDRPVGAPWWGGLRANGVRVLVEVRDPRPLEAAVLAQVDGVLVKGNECGGFVGEDASFILLQKWLARTLPVPLYTRGGLTPHVAAACHAVGIAGGVLDSQLLLMEEVRLPEALRTQLANLSGSETVAAGNGETGEYFRLLVRPGLNAARDLVGRAEGLNEGPLREIVHGRAAWHDAAQALLPIGQDVAFAAVWRRQYGRLGGVLAAIDAAVAGHAATARASRAIAEGAPLAQALGTRFPLIQGPMTRVSDTAEFALAVSEGGALPMVAFATVKGPALEKLLVRTTELMGDRPWGIGLLGFAPQSLLDEQLAAALRHSPSYAIIAGGRPDQAVQLERTGIPTFLHVPSANLIPSFLQEGARRFIFEGRECGGHIGPLSSFVLWSSMVDRLLAELGPAKVDAQELQLIFAGGIHDALSSAVVQVLIAPLVAAGAKVGLLMGSGYLFTKEIVASGSIVEQFQREVVECEHTVNLESGPGHASRCAYTPFAHDFFRQRAELKAQGVPGDESRRVLDDLILGRLRIASKGSKRDGLNGPLVALDDGQQRAEGMYMLGQVATLRDAVTTIDALHADVTSGAEAVLARTAAAAEVVEADAASAPPADIAIIGVGVYLPKARDAGEYWENIIAKVDAIGEIPAHRWDWRLYFDADRQSPDKVYSRWGGFLEDMAFDPTRYGMPPVSIKSVDPMQLMGLEVALRTLVDAGYGDRPFDREKASVILGASGGAGDIGMQYGLRSELPRFLGELPAELAAQLPEWTEDSFAGILPNVAAGRIANRLNFGGMNVLVDAACASSLAAVYQGVNELAAGRSDLVIAGGIDTVQGPFGYLCFSKTQALSPRGRCSTFDADGDGIVISEGIAMIALKRLADAERDGDRVYAVIKGVGASSDGNAKGLTAPLPAGQLRAMRRAYAMAGFGPSTVGLFEAHGTGTVAGDTAELESTTRLMREESAPARHAVIGSVKTMIGHTKATAGVAGLIKAALSLHHRVLPPHRNVTTPNRVLADPAAPLYLVDEAMPWLDGEQPRRAACSAFGFGGTNFHIVLEQHSGEYREWLQPGGHNAWSAELLVWSDADRSTLATRLEALKTGLAEAPALLLRDLAASLAARWRPRAETLAIVARTVDDLRAKLDAAIGHARDGSKALPPGVFWGSATARLQGKVAVLFPGQGSQYPGMAREAALHFAPVAQSLADADAALAGEFASRFGSSTRLSHFVHPRGAYGEDGKAEARRRLTSTDVAQPALGAVEVGLFRQMQQLGLKGDMFAGHSYGEFVALHAAGMLDFDALMQLSAARGRFIVDAAAAEGAELGTMAAVSAPRKVVEDAIADIDGVIIANHNAPTQCIISGTRDAVATASRKLAEGGSEVADIPVAAAFHSVLVKPAQQALSDLINATPWSPATAPVYSNASARPHSAEVARVKRQMAEHLVCPVEFVAQVEEMYKDGARIFVEVGPKSVLTRLTGKILAGREHVAIAIDDGSGLGGLLGGVAQLLCAGMPIDLAPLFARRDCRIGDAAAPAALQRIEPVSKHAWMLNGSAARRASEPVRQVGTSLEAVQARIASAPVATTAPATPPITPISTPGASVAAPAMPTPVWRKSRPMDERRTPPGGMADAVMSEYFHTMRQFLDTQERVMAGYLGAEPAPRAALPVRARPAPVALPRVAEVTPALPVAAPARAVITPPVAVPAPAAAPVPAPVVAAAPVPKATPAPAAAKAPEPAADSGVGMTRASLADMLLSIIEEKTGYPRDMVGLDQNLEADLGIDSIKRIEVVGALLQQLPAAHRDALTESRSKLNTQPTLNGMLDLVTQAKVGGAVAVPFDVAGVGSRVVLADHPPRHVVRPMPDPVPAGSGRHLVAGRFVITRDALGVAETLAAALTERGRIVTVVEREALGDESALLALCQSMGDDAIAGAVHLAAVGAPALDDAAGPDGWRAALQVNEKSWFLLLRELSARLAEDAHVVSASALGGLFGREGTAASALTLQSGAVGAVKSLLAERSALRVKAIDLDPRRSAAEMAADLLDELMLDGGRQEIGYPGGVRTAFVSAPETVAIDPARQAALNDVVVLATGGARGITAEVLRDLARPGNTLILTGRSTLPESEDADTAGLPDADALRKHFVAQVRAGALKLTPGDVQKRVQNLLALREMRLNIADLRAGGAQVEYHAVDVVDEPRLVALLADLRARFGRVDGIVHGAGVIEDKLLADKRSDSWSRVVETKVLGLLALARHVDAAALKFFVVFSSVAGRYGNSGQSDYATANELMNRLCLSLQVRWGPGVVVSALCWGPWGATKFGAGMVTAETEAKFAAKGVGLVTADLGRKLFREELAREAGHTVEVICGAAPWESREVELGVIRAAAAGTPLGALLGHTEATSLPTGERIVPVVLDPKRHLYLQEHALDDKMVLPAAAALELIAEAARALWPGWQVAEVREHRLMKGVEMKAACQLEVFLSPPPYGSSEGFDVSAALRSDIGNGRSLTHYRAVVRLEPMLQNPVPPVVYGHDERSLSVAKAYGEWLFHGPRFQVIQAIDGLSEQGASARVRISTPASWLAATGASTPSWVFDPALVDAAAQMAWLWARAYRDESALPTRFGRVVRYRDTWPETLTMAYERIPTTDATLVRANVWFLDEQGTPVMAIEELDSVASAALNRLGGTARTAVETA